MIASIGNSYAAGILARSNAARPTGATFDHFTSGPSSAVGQTADAPTVQGAASASSASDSNPPDFTSMTRQQLRDWTNDQIKSGKMSFDDGSALALMSGRIAVEGTPMDDGSYTQEKVDFIGLVQNGIAGAQSRHDQKAIDRLEKALTIMGRSQKSTKTSNISAAESSVKLKEALETFKKEALPTPDSANVVTS